MNFKSERDGAYKNSWVNDFSNNVKLANELNNAYADDIIQAVEEKDFDTLESALEDLRVRIGVTKAAMKDIKRIAIAKLAGKTKQASDGEACGVDVEVEATHSEEIPGNVTTPGKRLEKETDKVASGMNPGFQAYLDKKNGKKPKDEEGKEDEKKDKKDAKATRKAKVKAWFQGANEPTKEGEVTTNDPAKMGYPKEMGYDKKPMETTAPGGQDSRPFEDKKFHEEATETKKDMGPAGEEFKVKVKMQRIPEGEKEANASAWAKALKKSGSEEGVKFIQHVAWKKAIEKKK